MLHSDTIVRHNDYTNENPLSDRRSVSAPTFLVVYILWRLGAMPW